MKKSLTDCAAAVVMSRRFSSVFFPSFFFLCRCCCLFFRSVAFCQNRNTEQARAQRERERDREKTDTDDDKIFFFFRSSNNALSYTSLFRFSKVSFFYIIQIKRRANEREKTPSEQNPMNYYSPYRRTNTLTKIIYLRS